MIAQFLQIPRREGRAAEAGDGAQRRGRRDCRPAASRSVQGVHAYFLSCQKIDKYLILYFLFQKSGDGLIELRRIEAAEEIAADLSRSRQITYLPQGQNTLLNLPQQ